VKTHRRLQFGQGQGCEGRQQLFTQVMGDGQGVFGRLDSVGLILYIYIYLLGHRNS